MEIAPLEPHATLTADGGGAVALTLDERPRSLSDIVYETLHQAIVNKVLAPGVPVTEPGLAKRLQVSKTPVREALLRLRHLGLIEQDGPRGLRVVRLAADDVRQIYEIREALEAFTSARAATRATPDDRERIAAAARASLEAAEVSDKDGFRAADRELHRTIGRLADNARIWQLISDASALISTLLQRDFPSGHGLTNCGHAHVAVADAIASGDPVAAADRMTAHIREVRGLMLEVIETRDSST